MKPLTKTLSFIALLIFALSLFGYVIQSSPHASTQATVNIEPIRTAKVAKANTANTTPNNARYRSCIAQANKSQNTMREISCEQIVEGAAQKYNECVTDMALNQHISTAPEVCETKCKLPDDVLAGLVKKHDEAMAHCRTFQEAALQ